MVISLGATGANQSPRSGNIRITVNGALTECPAGLSIGDLLLHLALPQDRVAVERNREIVRRDARNNTPVHQGDVLEIVTFVGGG